MDTSSSPNIHTTQQTHKHTQHNKRPALLLRTMLATTILRVQLFQRLARSFREFTKAGLILIVSFITAPSRVLQAADKTNKVDPSYNISGQC